MDKPLSHHVLQMKTIADMLVPYSNPAVDFGEEYLVLPLKCRTVCVEGYEVALNLSKSDFEKYHVYSLQIQAAYTPFLPFSLVCKIGRRFLGSDHLAYIDFIKNNKKIYCWTVKMRDGRPVPASKKTTPHSYEGFEYALMQEGSINLYES